MTNQVHAKVGPIGADLSTEQRNPKSANLHELEAEEILALINEEDAHAVEEAKRLIPITAQLVESAVKAIQSGGSVHYFGAGTSGRIAAQDAAELFPTFNAPAGMVVSHMAGGEPALIRAAENAEDNHQNGHAEASVITENDIVIGLTASGRTPYVGGALLRAKEVGAVSALIACVAKPELSADIVIAGNTGAEILTGSTRLKAATFQKAVLTGFSTALMVRLGRTYSNLMVSLVATNEKLHSRSIRILMEGSGLDLEKSTELLKESDGDLRLALVSGIAGVEPAEAKPHLQKADGVVHLAVHSLQKTE